MTAPEASLKWYKALDNVEDLPEGRMTTVTAKHQGICLAHFEGKTCALDNKCPHRGGPPGEGSIENGLVRCPWHGWDYHPCTGKAPGFDVWATSLHNPDFAAYANGCGALGIKVKEKENLTGAMKKILDHKSIALLEVITDVDLI